MRVSALTCNLFSFGVPTLPYPTLPYPSPNEEKLHVKGETLILKPQGKVPTSAPLSEKSNLPKFCCDGLVVRSDGPSWSVAKTTGYAPL